VSPNSISPDDPAQSAGYAGSVVRALLWGIPVTLLAAIGQGLVALRFEVGLLYVVIGCYIGSVIRTRSPRLPVRSRQVLAMILTYLAVVLSPLVFFVHTVGFDLIRMRNITIGLVLGFVPVVAKTGVVGILNLGLLLYGLRLAWVYAHSKPIQRTKENYST
jgi:hypothetical protein